MNTEARDSRGAAKRRAWKPDGHRRSGSALDAAKRINLGPYADWTEPARLVFNVERAYRELRGEPFDAPIDVIGLFHAMHELERHCR